MEGVVRNKKECRWSLDAIIPARGAKSCGRRDPQYGLLALPSREETGLDPASFIATRFNSGSNLPKEAMRLNG